MTLWNQIIMNFKLTCTQNIISTRLSLEQYNTKEEWIISDWTRKDGVIRLQQDKIRSLQFYTQHNIQLVYVKIVILKMHKIQQRETAHEEELRQTLVQVSYINNLPNGRSCRGFFEFIQ